jgi:hypothetical protein
MLREIVDSGVGFIVPLLLHFLASLLNLRELN